MESDMLVPFPFTEASADNYSATEQHDEDAMDDTPEGWLGNRKRRLWKSTCIRAALNV